MKADTLSVAIFLMGAVSCCASVGFQQVTVPDIQGKPLDVAIWYPSTSSAECRPLGMFTQVVALNGDVAGTLLPLILISHGNSGSFASHYDTALALAEAGFVVGALTHTGDNYMDQSYAGNRIDLIDRGCVSAAPKRIGLRSNRRLSGVGYNSSLVTSSDVSTHLRPG